MFEGLDPFKSESERRKRIESSTEGEADYILNKVFLKGAESLSPEEFEILNRHYPDILKADDEDETGPYWKEERHHH